MGRLFGFLKRNLMSIIAAVAAVVVVWIINDTRDMAQIALEVTGSFETRIKSLESKAGSLETAVGSLNGSLRSFAAASAQTDSEASARMDSLALEVSATAFVADTAMTRASSARKDAREARKAVVAHTAADSARWVRADSLREEIADRQFRADSAIVVSQATLAAVERKTDGALIRADSLDAARERHEAALADLASRMGGKKKK